MVVGACIRLRGEWSRIYIEVFGRGKPEAAEEEPKEEATAALEETPVAVPAEAEVESMDFVDSRRRNQQVLKPQVALGSNLGCHRWFSAATCVSGFGDSSPVPEAEPGAAEEEPRRGCPALVEDEVESKAWVSGNGAGWFSRESGEYTCPASMEVGCPRESGVGQSDNGAGCKNMGLKNVSGG